jgi:hypothetical protein
MRQTGLGPDLRSGTLPAFRGWHAKGIARAVFGRRARSWLRFGGRDHGTGVTPSDTDARGLAAAASLLVGLGLAPGVV